jgi:hypothetical protein
MSSIRTSKLARWLGHAADRDRPTHLLPAGYDDWVGPAPDGTLCSHRFDRVTHRRREVCVVCLAFRLIARASDRDRGNG